MQKRSIDWEDLHTFVALAEVGNLSGAARRLAVSHATVGRRVAALEERVGGALGALRPEGYRPTPLGELVLASARSMAAEAASLDRSLSDAATDGLTGSVRLTSIESIGTHVLAPALDQLWARHPALQVELVMGDERLSLARREADIAVRLARPPDSELVARQLARIDYGLYARADLAPQWADKPLEAPFVGFEAEGPAFPERVWLDTHVPVVRRRFRSNHLTAQCNAVLAGAGVGLLPCYQARKRPALVALSSGPVCAREAWLVYHRDQRNVPRVRAVADWLVAIFDAQREAFEWPAASDSPPAAA